MNLSTKIPTSRFFSFFFLLAVVFSSCQEEIELEPSKLPPRLVVDGRITNEMDRHAVRLHQSGDYRLKGDYPPAEGASVQLSDGQHKHLLREVEPGLYLTDSLAGIPGKVYSLQIDWEGESIPPEIRWVPFRLPSNQHPSLRKQDIVLSNIAVTNSVFRKPICGS